MFSLEAPGEIEGEMDVLIIGAGPAGMTATVYLARKKLSATIVTKDIGGQVAWTLGIENYIGYQYVTGRELTAKFEEQVRQFSIPVVKDEVKEIMVGNNGCTAVTEGSRNIDSRAVIVASGKRPRELGVPNEQKFVGRGLSNCATCDGPLYSNQDVAICGGGNSAIQAALEMSKIASKVYVVSRSPWRADPIVVDKADRAKNLERRIGHDALEITGDAKVEGLKNKR